MNDNEKKLEQKLQKAYEWFIDAELLRLGILKSKNLKLAVLEEVARKSLKDKKGNLLNYYSFDKAFFKCIKNNTALLRKKYNVSL